MKHGYYEDPFEMLAAKLSGDFQARDHSFHYSNHGGHMILLVNHEQNGTVFYAAMTLDAAQAFADLFHRPLLVS